MDEGGGLENRYMGNCIVGSNPTPSASYRHKNRSLSNFRDLMFFRDFEVLLTDRQSVRGDGCSVVLRNPSSNFMAASSWSPGKTCE